MSFDLASWRHEVEGRRRNAAAVGRLFLISRKDSKVLWRLGS
jgi:hypothetical protein